MAALIITSNVVNKNVKKISSYLSTTDELPYFKLIFFRKFYWFSAISWVIINYCQVNDFHFPIVHNTPPPSLSPTHACKNFFIDSLICVYYFGIETIPVPILGKFWKKNFKSQCLAKMFRFLVKCGNFWYLYSKRNIRKLSIRGCAQ